VTIELETYPDAEAAAQRVAEVMAERAAASKMPFSLALSRASPELLTALAGRLPWGRATVYQVDERVAPVGSDDRNATALLASLPRERLELMPVDEPDLDAAAAAYAGVLPERLDIVHLGLGPDGHTASLLPGEPVLEARDRPVAVTGEYQGYRRMTLTFPPLEAARHLVWLVTGESKRDALRQLLARDESIPAGRIQNPAQLVVADEAAAP
jgi:6-phosphogluconolactonase